MSLNLPNILTLLRLALIPLFMGIFYLPFAWARPVSALIFALAGLTDWLDGYLARRWEQASAFGAFLDPVVDKLMVATALVLLVNHDGSFLLVIPAVVIIGREIAVSALREWMAELGQRGAVAVSAMGKRKTMAQLAALAFLLYEHPIAGMPTYPLGVVLIYVAAALTLWSMVMYLRAAWESQAE